MGEGSVMVGIPVLKAAFWRHEKISNAGLNDREKTSGDKKMTDQKRVGTRLEGGGVPVLA